MAMMMMTKMAENMIVKMVVMARKMVIKLAVEMVLEIVPTITDNHLLTMKKTMVKRIEVSKVNDVLANSFSYMVLS